LLDEYRNYSRTELDRRNLGQASTEFTDAGAAGCDDDCVYHFDALLWVGGGIKLDERAVVVFHNPVRRLPDLEHAEMRD
jgi:hypothetical protein